MKPNFLILGAMRCGTTFLSSSLALHPQVFLCRPKEVNFFNDDSNYARGLNWYAGHFEGSDNAIAVGEASTRYSKCTVFPDAAKRIALHLPTAKLIYIVRDPLARIESNWKHYLRWGDAQLDFNRAVEAHPEWIDTSCYWLQINTYREHFPDEQILILFLDELERDPGLVLGRCYEFLGLDASLPLHTDRPSRNRSAGRAVDGNLLRRLRRSSLTRALGQWAPRGLKRAAKGILTYEVPSTTPLWNEALRRATVARVAPDASRFLEFCNRPPDHWSLGGGSECD